MIFNHLSLPPTSEGKGGGKREEVIDSLDFFIQMSATFVLDVDE